MKKGNLKNFHLEKSKDKAGFRFMICIPLSLRTPEKIILVLVYVIKYKYITVLYVSMLQLPRPQRERDQTRQE